VLRDSAFLFLSSLFLSPQLGLNKKLGEKKMRLFTLEHPSLEVKKKNVA
jgi:hypothetical protein